jgi:hypothetical protein
MHWLLSVGECLGDGDGRGVIRVGDGEDVASGGEGWYHQGDSDNDTGRRRRMRSRRVSGNDGRFDQPDGGSVIAHGSGGDGDGDGEPTHPARMGSSREARQLSAFEREREARMDRNRGFLEELTRTLAPEEVAAAALHKVAESRVRERAARRTLHSAGDKHDRAVLSAQIALRRSQHAAAAASVAAAHLLNAAAAAAAALTEATGARAAVDRLSVEAATADRECTAAEAVVEAQSKDNKRGQSVRLWPPYPRR